MAEALAAVGVASSIIALVDFSMTLYGHIKEITADVHDVPKSFRPINTQLPVLMRTLEGIGKAFKEGKLDEETAKVVAPTVERFKTSIQELEELLAGVLLDPKDRRSKKLWKTLRGVAKESEVKGIVEDIRGYVGTLTFYLVASASSLQPLKDEKLMNIRRWLLAPDPDINYQKALLERQANTGQWFLESSLYQDWRESGSSIWLHGIPGCGKTILSTTVVENIQQYTAEDPAKVLAYFYFDFKDQQKQGPDSMVRSLIYQLSQQFISIPEELERLYDSCNKEKTQPFSNTLLATLQPVIRGFPHTFIIIDALDECTQREDLMKTIKEILRWQIEGLHVLVTSRREGDIENTLGQILEERSILSIQTEVVTQDIQLYVHERLSHDDRLRKWRTDAALHQKIEATLLSNARGMFRWAVCQLDFLRECRNRRQLLQALDTLPPTLDATYDRIFSAIRESDQPYALRILRWLTFATRPLYLLEVAEIAAMDPDRVSIFDREEILEDPSDVISICASLVVVTDERRDRCNDPFERQPQYMPIVQLAHYSVKEYLVSQRISGGPAALFGLDATLCHTQIAKCCLQYLRHFENIDDLHERPLQEFAMKTYSAKNWAVHVQDGFQNDKEIQDLCFDFLSNSERAFALWHKLYECRHQYVVSVHDIEKKKLPPPIYFASLFGLSHIVERMLENGEDPNAQCETPPLQAAAESGHISTVNVLIRKGANVNQSGGTHSNALSAALYRGHIDVARTLMDYGANIKAQSRLTGPAINTAIIGGIDAVKLVLEQDRNLYVVGGKYGNALQMCASSGDPEIAEVLIEHGAQINGLQGHLNTALQVASMDGNFDMVKTLLAHDADIHELNGEGKSAIHEALKGGHVSIAKHLIEHSAARTVTSPRFNFDLALIKAAEKGDIDAATLLLEHGADANVNGSGFDKKCPIRWALINEHFDMVKLLILHGIDANAIVDHWNSPFMFTIRWGDLDQIKFLIEHGAAPNGQGEFKGLPLLLASGGRYDVVRLLIEHGADVSWYCKGTGSAGCSALERACGRGQLETVQLLILRGASINHGDLERMHPLQSAARYGQLDVARYLLEKGADTNSKIAGMNTAVLVGNIEMTALLLDHLAVSDIPEDNFGETLRCAVSTERIYSFHLSCEKGCSLYTLSDTPAAVWNPTKPLDMVRFLIEKGVNVNARDHEESTALIQATRLRAIDVAEFLIEKGANVNIRDRQNSTALVQALSTGYDRHYDMVKLLTEKGADPNVRDDNHGTPLRIVLHSPSLDRRLDIAKLLVEQGADVNERDDEAGTLLEDASLQGNFDLVKALIEKGANVEDSRGRFGSALIAASCSDQDNPGITNMLLQAGANIHTEHFTYGSALSAASKRGHLQVVRLLLERGVSANNQLEALQAALQSICEKARQASDQQLHRIKSRNVNIIELLMQRGASFGSNSTVVDLVLQAAVNNDIDVMKMLIEGSSSSRAFNGEIFDVILWIASCRGQKDMIQLLFSTERKLESRGCEAGQIEKYSLALKSALSEHHFDIALILIEKGANTDLSHLQWKECFQIASSKGYLGIVRFLIEKDTDFKQAADTYGNALVSASASGHHAITAFLIENGVDVDSPSQYCWTALSAASSEGHYELVELLISKGADVNASNEAFGTALLAASARKHHNIVRLLILKGADINATDEKFGSAFMVAITRKDYKLSGILSRRGADINVQGGKYGNALQAALAKRCGHIAEILIRDGADINVQGGKYGNALQAALAKRLYLIARALIQKGADINAQGGKFGNALQATLSIPSDACDVIGLDNNDVAQERRCEMAMFLIENGADLNVQGGKYGSALLAAFSNSYYHIADVLIQKGANVNARASFGADGLMLSVGDSAASAALLGGFPDTARKLLLEQKLSSATSITDYRNMIFLAIALGNIGFATILIDQADGSVPLDDQLNDIFLKAITCQRDIFAIALIDRGANIDARDECGHSALQLAALSMNFFMVKTLVEKGVDINACGTEHGTILQTLGLMFCAHSDYARSYFIFDSISYLLEQGADLNVQGGRYGNALQAIIRSIRDSSEHYNDDDIPNFVNMFIDKGADINAQGGEYGSALQAALCLGKPAIAEILIRKGADIHMLGGIHDNMVQAALFGNCRDLAEVLIRQGVDVSANDGFDEAISTALSKGYDNVVNLLLEDCKDLDLTDEELDSSLQEAVLEGDVDSAKAWTNLIVKYSKPDGWQRKLNDAVAAALAHGHHDIFEFLIGKGAKIDLEAFRRCADV